MKKEYKKMIIIQLVFLIIGILTVIIINTNLINFIPKCWINEKFGLLCTSCGGTRCVINFLQGNFIKAFKYHSVFFLIIIYILITDIVYIINTLTNKNIAKWLYPKPYYLIIWTVILAIYTIARNILIFVKI